MRRAVEELNLAAPRIALSARGQGFVGVPVWLWLADGQAVTSPASATAAVGAASVTATARLVSVEWALGPPGARVVCAGPGTPWTGQPGPSPDCGYTYRLRSLPDTHGRDGAVADHRDHALAGRLAGHLGRGAGGRAGGRWRCRPAPRWRSGSCRRW